MICIGTHTYSKRQFTYDFTLATSTGVVELKFQKHGFPQSINTTTGELQKKRTAERTASQNNED